MIVLVANKELSWLKIFIDLEPNLLLTLNLSNFKRIKI